MRNICRAVFLSAILYSCSICAGHASQDALSELSGGSQPMEKEILALSMRVSVMSAVEGAFAYLLLADAADKDNFFININLFDKYANRFQKVISQSKTSGDKVRVQFEAAAQGRNSLQEAAERIFGEFETADAASRKSLALFEEALNYEVDALEKLTNTVVGSSRPGVSIIDMLDIRACVFGGVEESYAYILLDDIGEKEEAIAKFKKAKDAIAGVQQKYCADEIFLIKVRRAEDSLEKLSAARAAMHKAFEGNKVKDRDSVMRFQQAIHEFEFHFDPLIQSRHSAT